ncbi:MAG: D-alanyl-D-alanine carboxypeptidase/D-alanyl-D-alanine-endopeptidase [Saprospiraceae bacterium]|nr:D-alanyl-D-alanine carboxypeptidase/D-alanyl-D-alanine-endopeptidase [Saprospiraceae bacterium]
MKLFRIGLLLLLLSSQVRAVAQKNIQNYLDQWVQDPELRHAGIGIVVKTIGQPDRMAAHNPDLSLIPASTLKILTTATGLAVLGKDFRFKTEVQYDGSIDAAGQLNGNVYLKGYGDPTLGSDQMPGVPDMDTVMEWFRLALQQQGIRSILGNIYGDASFFPSAVSAPTWPWYDLGNYYGAGAWGLNIHENLYYLDFKQVPNLGETPPIQALRPAIAGMTFINEVTTAATGRGGDTYIYGAPYTYERFVRGTIGRGNGTITIKGAIPDPPQFAAQYLLEKIQAIGITVSGEAVALHRMSPKTGSGLRQTLFEYTSPDLQEISQRANQKSVNLYCESILRQLGIKASGNPDRTAGITAMQNFWQQKSLDFSGVFVEDGSGLSPRNALTSRFLTEALEQIAQSPDWFDSFFSTLPVTGENGTLSYMLRNTPAQGRVFAKSGSMERVRAYAGYLRTEKDQLLAFSILVNNYTCTSDIMRKKIEELLLFLVQS